MEKKYYVDWTSHNSETGAWNYKQTKQFDDLSAAKKEFFNALGTYIAYGKLDFFMAILYDSYGNKIDSEFWDVRVEPEPTE